MFPLLSRLPQLSLKRDSQSACLLIHLNFSNKKTPPMSSCFPSLFHPRLMHFLIQTSIHSAVLYYTFLSCTRPPPPSACVSPAASPHLSALRGFNGEPSTPTFLLIIPLPPPCFAAGHRERKKTKSVNVLDCTQPEEK